MKYSQELATKYSNQREQFNETDQVFLEEICSIGIANKDILDVGCGDGRHAKYIKSLGAKSVVGIDINKKMIEIANNNSEDISFKVADGKHVPLEDESVDVVVSNFVIHYFPVADEIFSEMSRVLRKGGFLVGTFNITNVDNGFEHLYNQSMPIRLGKGENSIIVQNLIKSREEIELAILTSGFVVKMKKN